MLAILGLKADRTQVAFAYINSKRYPVGDQFLLTQAENTFLKHDSYLDCCRIYEETFETLYHAIQRSPACHIGMLNSQNIEEVKCLIKDSMTIPKKLKKMYGFL